MKIDIKNDEEYEKILREISALMTDEPEEDSEGWIRLDQLATAVEEYEAKYYPINLGKD